MKSRGIFSCHYRHGLLILALFVNIVMIAYLAFLQNKLPKNSDAHEKDLAKTMPAGSIASQVKHQYYVEDSVTFVITEVKGFDNDLKAVVKHLLAHASFKGGFHKVLVITDGILYPPVDLPKSPHINVVNMKAFPELGYNYSRPEAWIKTQYVLFIPDATQFLEESDALHYMLSYHKKLPASSNIKMAAWSADAKHEAKCLGLRVKLKQWTLQYYTSEKQCDALQGNYLLLIKSKDLLSLSQPFQTPLEDALFIQTQIQGWRISLDSKVLTFKTRHLFEDSHNAWKQARQQQASRERLYADFGFKLIQRDDEQEEWHGCSKTTQRCFGTIIDDMPEYLYLGRWTPPCCLRAIRITARHVFRILESCNVRYWLEGGSLLGAARHGDIIPWDYDVDIGIYKDDIDKCYHLVSGQSGDYEDEDGFIWEMASEGDFFRVQYSRTNHLHVDIFPFFSRNGTMTKDTWIKTHKQDREFPESYLKPLSQINFAGTQAFAPNNWRKFLELKFGAGVIENPQYPDNSVVGLGNGSV